MSNGVARINDTCIGTCNNTSHNGTVNMTGYIISSAKNIYAEGNRQVARIGDTVLGNCGHTGTIVSASTIVIQEPTNKGIARIGDTFIGDFSGTIVSGDKTTIIG